MIITCEQCETRYKLADELISQPIFKVKCSKCGKIFTVHKPEEIKPLDLPEEAALPDFTPYKIISVSNQKGGVAKTSSAINLGMALALRGKKVLLIDFDTQASLTIALGHGGQARTFYDLLHVPGATLANVIAKTRYPNLWLLPAGPNLALLMKKNINRKNFETILRDKLEGIKDKIDHIIIDTPPSVEFFTLNALMASDFVIIPTQCEYLSMHGVAHIEEVIDIVRQRQNQDIDYKILITMFNRDSTAAKVIRDKLQTRYRDKIFETTIDFDVKLQESQIMTVPVAQYDENSDSARQYMALAGELHGENS